MNEGGEIIHVNEVHSDLRFEEPSAYVGVSVRGGIMKSRPPISVGLVSGNVVIQTEVDKPEHPNHSSLVEACPAVDVIHEVEIKEIRSDG